MSRPTVEELIEEVLGIVDDSDYDADDVLKHFNRCNVRLAGILDTPDLATVGQVVSVLATNVVALPSDYLKGLNAHYNPTCYNVTTKEKIKVFGSRRLLDKRIRIIDQTGNIVGVAPYGRFLYYQKIPSAAQTLQIPYFRIPDNIVESGLFPTYIPEGYVSELYLNFACSYLFSPIEDGIEGEKTNTIFHKGEFNTALLELKTLYGPDPEDPYYMDEPTGDFNFEI